MRNVFKEMYFEKELLTLYYIYLSQIFKYSMTYKSDDQTNSPIKAIEIRQFNKIIYLQML